VKFLSIDFRKVLGSRPVEMNSRSIGLLAAIGMLAAWLAAAAGIGFDSSPAPRPGPASPLQTDPLVAQIQSQSSRLHGYLNSVPPLKPVRRDPFRFGARPAPASPAGVGTPRLVEDASLAATELAVPLKLAGVAEDSAGDAIVRTAIISGMGQLFLVKEGEEFGGRFRVVRIGPDAASVTDRTTGMTVTLALK
jgi:hypothetical protein